MALKSGKHMAVQPSNPEFEAANSTQLGIPVETFLSMLAARIMAILIAYFGFVSGRRSHAPHLLVLHDGSIRVASSDLFVLSSRLVSALRQCRHSRDG